MACELPGFSSVEGRYSSFSSHAVLLPGCETKNIALIQFGAEGLVYLPKDSTTFMISYRFPCSHTSRLSLNRKIVTASPLPQMVSLNSNVSALDT